MLIQPSLIYILGAVVGFLYFIYQVVLKYTKIKTISLPNKLIVGSFIVYIFAIIGITLFPLPLGSAHLAALRDAGMGSGKSVNFLPFFSIYDTVISQERTSNTFQIFRQLGGNVLLLVPLGIYIPLIYKKKLKDTILVGIGFSFIIEIVQFIIGLVINLAYRISDIDDIILNTIGVIIGYSFLKFFLPQYDKLLSVEDRNKLLDS